jgi:hypothetical protein
MFRHGARTPVFSLPDASLAESPDWQGLVLKAPPPHAVQIEVHGGNSWKREVSASQVQGNEPGRVNAGAGGGQLTNLGWAQGEALGNRLRSTYGAPRLDSLQVVSTDMPRTVETAHAVLTGLLRPHPPENTNIVINVLNPSPWVPHTRCSKLAELMSRGREAFRQQLRAEGARRGGAAHETRLAISLVFGPLHDQQPISVLAVHDDCQARRWHGLPPSPCVDVALCDAASREATREVMAALSAHGPPSWKLRCGIYNMYVYVSLCLCLARARARSL